MRCWFETFRLVGKTLGLTVLLAGAAGAQPPSHRDFDQADGALIDNVERRNRAFEGFLRAEVAAKLNEARGVMGTHPEQAAASLAVLADKVRQAGEISPDLRAELTGQIDLAIRAARRQKQIHEERQQSQQPTSQLDVQGRVRRLAAQEREVDRSLSRYHQLMAEGRYQDAESLAAVAQETKPGDGSSRTAALTARTVGYTTAMNTVRDMRGRGYLDVQYQTELSSIPTADEPPILYPDPEVWQLLSQRRNRYRGFDMSHRSLDKA